MGVTKGGDPWVVCVVYECRCVHSVLERREGEARANFEIERMTSTCITRILYSFITV